MMNKKGFTLVELMVVIVIIGVLAAVAIPKFMTAVNKAKASELPSCMSQITAAEEVARTETNQFVASDSANLNAKLGVDAANQKYFSYSVTATNDADPLKSVYLATAKCYTSFGGLTAGSEKLNVGARGDGKTTKSVVGTAAGKLELENYVRSYYSAIDSTY